MKKSKSAPIQFTLLAITVLCLAHLTGLCGQAAGEPAPEFATIKSGNPSLRLHFETCGKGPSAIVFIHGAMSDATAWQLQATARWASTPQHVIVRMLELGILPDAESAIWRPDPIQVPVLGIYSTNPYVPADNEDYLKSFAADVEYQAWAGVSHDLVKEQSGRFNQAVLAFLAKHKTELR